MEAFEPRFKRPEDKIRDELIRLLSYKGWYVKITVGTSHQAGFPDLYATHYKYGPRWIEVKLPHMKGSRFTPAQLEEFPKFVANGSGIWILTSATEEEYNKLFRKHNLWEYML